MAKLVAVRHHDLEPIQLGARDLGQTGPDLGRVYVAVHRGDRRDSLEIDHDLPLAHVTAVQDVIDLAEYVEYLRPQEAVRVGDEIGRASCRERVWTAVRPGCGEH